MGAAGLDPTGGPQPSQREVGVSGERFREQGAESLLGDFLYEQVVPPEHFLPQLQVLLPWQHFSKKLAWLYLGKQARQGPFNPCWPRA